MSLLHNQTIVFDAASRASIEAEYINIKNNWATGTWLNSINKYTKDPIKEIKKHKYPTHSHLRQYIAASAIAHCMDGWSFLGRSVEAHLRGDSDVSKHLGYYAELRGAMALLASEGIGVFDQKHFIVNGRRKCNAIPKPKRGTHVFTWEALERWSDSNSAADLLFSIIKPGGVKLGDWIDQFSLGGGTRTIIASHWLTQWGIDIKRLAADRDSRNFASYRPTAFTSPRSLNVTETLRLIDEFWNIFEPDNSCGFNKLDKYLLKYSLQYYFLKTHTYGRTHRQATRIFQQRIHNMLNNIPFIVGTTETWESYLVGANYEPCYIIDNAKGNAGPRAQNHHLQVIARASLLLRIATGSCRKSIDTLTESDKNNMRFWWTQIGEDRALWKSGSEPTSFSDLWTDVRESLNNISTWIEDPTVCPDSCYSLWKDSSAIIGSLGTCERIGLWGLGLR